MLLRSLRPDLNIYRISWKNILSLVFSLIIFINVLLDKFHRTEDTKTIFSKVKSTAWMIKFSSSSGFGDIGLTQKRHPNWVDADIISFLPLSWRIQAISRCRGAPFQPHRIYRLHHLRSELPCTWRFPPKAWCYLDSHNQQTVTPTKTPTNLGPPVVEFLQ